MPVIEMEYKKCIEACHECILACEVCISHMAVKKSNNDCPACCIQCAEVCSLCIRAMAGDWVHVTNVGRLASEVCAWCAQNCREVNDAVCQRCADVCDRCSRECHEMAA